jgi:hypothetical protein
MRPINASIECSSNLKRNSTAANEIFLLRA